MPIVSGDKGSYGTWKDVFMVCIDNMPITAELKLLRLRQCLSGTPLKSIETYGYLAAANQAALRLELKYGGHRRQAAVHIEALHKKAVIPDGNGAQMERFADLLQAAVINLKDTGQETVLYTGVCLPATIEETKQ